MEAPQRVRDVQRLNGCITALGRFISRLGERALPFFKLLKKRGPIEWTPEADEAFKKLKHYLSSPPILVAARPGEPLLLYVAATTQVVSAVLVAERKKKAPGEEDPESSAGGCPAQPTGCDPPSENNELQPEDVSPAPTEEKRDLVQRPVYFVSAVLRDAWECYTEI